MALSPATISSKRAKRNVKRLGRGNGSQKGTYSSRGLKGQKSRSGNKGIAARAFKQSLQKIPKLRGFKSFKTKPETVTLATLERVGEEGKLISPTYLKNKSVVKDARKGVKIVATGSIKKKLTLKGCLTTKAAQEAIEKAGGKLTF